MKRIVIPGLCALLATACTKQESTAAKTEPAAAEVAAAKPYPLDVCLVSGEELGSMGEPVVIVHEGQTIKFCCDKCQPKFEADPAKYLGELDKKTE